MSISIFLDIAIGVVLVWFTLAMVVMALQEWIAGITKLRATELEKAIQGMLQDPDLANKIYEHPLIQALSKKPKPRKESESKEKPKPRPSYIPARTFTLALFDVVMTAGTDASTIKGVLETLRKKESEVPQLADQAVRTALDELITLAADATNDETKLAGLKKQLDSFTAGQPQLKPVVDALLQTSLDKDAAKMLENVAGSAARLAVSNPQLAQSINSLITGVEAYAKEGETALAVARTNVETWFDDTMVRLGGWYKRRAQGIAFLLGLGLAIAVNMDSVAIVTTLWREPTTRAGLVAQAGALEKLPEVEADPSKAIKDLNEQIEELNLPVGWTMLEGEQCQEIPDENWALPVNARCIVPADAPEGIPSKEWYIYAVGKVVGWFISGLAAAQGAPFWFDVLKKLTNVRSSGKNPAEEKPKKED